MKLRIRHGTLFALLLLPLVSLTQVSGPLSLTGTGCVSVSVDNQSTVAMNISGGSWSGTIQPKASITGQTAANVQVIPSTSSTAASTITANGLYTATVAGYQNFRLCGNTVTGTATVYFSVTQRSAASRGASGGGAPTGTAGGDLSGTYPNPSVVNINGTAFAGTNGNLVGFGAANIPADSGKAAPTGVIVGTTDTQTLTNKNLQGGTNAVTYLNSNYSTSVLTGDSTDQVIFTYTLPAGSMIANRGVRITYRATQAGTTSTAYKIKFGGTAMYTISSTNANTMISSVEIMNQPGVTNAQFALPVPTVSGVSLLAPTLAEAAIDTTSPVVITFTFNVAATVTLTKYAWAVELIQ